MEHTPETDQPVNTDAAEHAVSIVSPFSEFSFSLPEKPMQASETNKGALGPARLAAYVTLPIFGSPVAIRRAVWLEDVVDAEAGTFTTQASFSLTGRKSDIVYDRKDPEAVEYVADLTQRVYAEFGKWYAVASKHKPQQTAKTSNAPRLVLDGRALTAAELASLRQRK